MFLPELSAAITLHDNQLIKHFLSMRLRRGSHAPGVAFIFDVPGVLHVGFDCHVTCDGEDGKRYTFPG